MITESELILEQMQPFEARLYQQMSVEHRQAYRNLRVRLDEYIFDFLAMNIRYFTSHGKRHSLGVMRQISHLLPDEILQSMSSVEVLMLLYGAWLHDIGLLVNRDEKGKLLTDEQIREQHHELGAQKIRQIAPWVDLQDAKLVQVLGDICACHRRSVKIADRLPKAERTIQEQRVRVQLLAALLRMADALDTDSQRAPQLFEQISDLSDQARLHWRICQMIELDYRPGEGLIHLEATFLPDKGLSQRDARDLIYNKFADLCDEWTSVQDIFQANQIPYRDITASFIIDGKGCDELDKTSLPNLEILPLEIVYYRSKCEQYLTLGQDIFASDWEYQQAQFYEQRSLKEPGSSKAQDDLKKASEHYRYAAKMLEREIARQPDDRYYLHTFHTFYSLKAKLIDHRFGIADDLTFAQYIFVNQLSMIQTSLDALERKSYGIWPLLRAGRATRQIVNDLLDIELYEMAEDGSVHSQCSLCTGLVVGKIVLAQKNKLAIRSFEWLCNPEQYECEWRGIYNKGKRVLRSFNYTATVLRCTLEFEHDQTGKLKVAENVARCLVTCQDRWGENLERPLYDVQSRIVYDLALYHRRQGKSNNTVMDEIQKSVVAFINSAIKLDPYTQVSSLPGLLLWREIKLSCRDEVRNLACTIVDRLLFNDPIWRPNGLWANGNARETSDRIENWLSFWEYYLLGDDLEDFPRLAGIEPENAAS